MDDVDRAKMREMLAREAALLAQQVRAKPTEPAKIINGKRICIDCDEPIPAARLAVHPSAVRCIECEEINEYRDRT